MKIDFETQDTEAGWQNRLDRLLLVAAPKWFEWMEWLLILGALTFVSEKTSNIAVQLITSISYVFLLLYFQHYFYKFEFVNMPLVKKHQRVARATSIAVSCLLGVGVYLLIKFSIADITRWSAI